MDFLSIQGLMGKLQAREERVNEIQEEVGVQTLFSKQDGFGYSQEERGKFRREVEAALIDQIVDRMKGTGRLVQLAVAIRHQDLTTGLTNQKLNAIIVKRQVIMLGIARIQPIGLKRMQIL
jgi:hypothetical protein